MKGCHMARWMIWMLLLLGCPAFGGCAVLRSIKASEARWQENPYTFNLDDHHEKNAYNPDSYDTYVYNKD